MNRYMLDSNMASHLIKEPMVVTRRVVTAPMTALCISAITMGELLFGLARRPDAKRLHRAVLEFLRRLDVLSWDSSIAEHYGTVRANLACRGKMLAPLDFLIAAHALGVNAVLVTNDQAFTQVVSLHVEDWSV